MNKKQAKKRARQITVELLLGYRAAEPEAVNHEIQKLIDRMDPPPETRPICPVCGKAVRLTIKGVFYTHWTAYGRCEGARHTPEYAIKVAETVKVERAAAEERAAAYREARIVERAALREAARERALHTAERMKAQQEDARRWFDTRGFVAPPPKEINRGACPSCGALRQPEGTTDHEPDCDLLWLAPK